MVVFVGLWLDVVFFFGPDGLFEPLYFYNIIITGAIFLSGFASRLSRLGALSLRVLPFDSQSPPLLFFRGVTFSFFR